jgi:DNA repair exonuclease SbcCD nuclease subunit
MKIISLSDWHIRSKVPSCRIDDFYEEQFKKVRQLIDWSTEYEAPILCAGDMLDNNRIGFRAYARLQHELQRARQNIFVIRGNHDSYAHSSDIEGTPLMALAEAGVIKLLERGTFFIDRAARVMTQACGWGKEPDPPTADAYNILMMHVPVFFKEIPFYFEGHGAFTSDSLRKKYPGYSLYLCGDIHIPFVDNNVVVSGSMTRTTTIQKDYRPRAYLIDTIKGTIDPLYFSIKEDVFKKEVSEISEEGYSQTLEGLVEAMKKSSGNKADFERDCLGLVADDLKVKYTLEEIFEHVKEA